MEKEMLDKMGFGTRAVHAGNVRDTQYGSLTMPIYQTSTVHFHTGEPGCHRFAGEEGGYIHTRHGNPTTTLPENKHAAPEGGEPGAAASSAMSTISP